MLGFVVFQHPLDSGCKAAASIQPFHKEKSSHDVKPGLAFFILADNPFNPRAYCPQAAMCCCGHYIILLDHLPFYASP